MTDYIIYTVKYKDGREEDLCRKGSGKNFKALKKRIHDGNNQLGGFTILDVRYPTEDDIIKFNIKDYNGK